MLFFLFNIFFSEVAIDSLQFSPFMIYIITFSHF